MKRSVVLAAVVPLLFSGSGCAWLIGAATSGLAEDVSTAILDQDDLATVRDGAPAYLLAIDGLIEGQPKNTVLLLAGANLYSAYASAFVEADSERMKRMTTRSRDYGLRALCVVNPTICEAVDQPFDVFVPTLQTADAEQLPELYGFGSAWASWVQGHADDWVAIAELPKIQAVIERVIALDDAYDDGQPHLYMGVLYTLRPASMGGKPEEGRKHFERAIEISDGHNLMAKVMLAESYARLVFDKELHDRLLNEVLAADPRSRGRTLVNMVARDQAKALLADSDEYF